MRKIVQIYAVPETQWNHHALYALCNDGTLWVYNPKQSTWEIKIPIPQDPQPELSFVEQRDRIAEMLDRKES